MLLMSFLVSADIICSVPVQYTGKIVADRLGIPVVVVPTIASTDAPCSACAVVYNEEGVVVRVEYQKRNPDLVLVDSEIIAQAPERFLVAGMGDALAT